MKQGAHTWSRVLVYTVLALVCTIMLLPSAYLICAAVKDTPDQFASLLLPSGSGLFGVAWDHLTFDNFRRLFVEIGVLRPLANSLFIAGATSVLASVICAAAGYALMQFQFPGQQVLLTVVFVCMVVPPVITLVPTYQELYWLHMLDTYAGLVLPYIAPAFGVLLFRQTFIVSVPSEIIEAGRIDGCSEGRIFFVLVLPFIRPMLTAFVVLVFVNTWNSFFAPQIVMQSGDKLPLTVAIAQLRSTYSQEYGLQMAGVVVAVIPLVVLFLVTQGAILSGILGPRGKE